MVWNINGFGRNWRIGKKFYSSGIDFVSRYLYYFFSRMYQGGGGQFTSFVRTLVGMYHINLSLYINLSKLIFFIFVLCGYCTYL